MTALATSQTLPAPQAITDPKQITSKPDARVEKSLSIEKLYMTRQVGGSTWSPDGWSPNGTTVAFVSNLSGRNNLWLVPSEGGWPIATHGQRPAPDQPDLVTGRQVDRLYVRLRRQRAVGHFSGVAENWTSREPHNTREIAEESPAWSADGRYLAYMVKPKTSSVFEIDVYDTVLREVKHLTTEPRKIA